MRYLVTVQTQDSKPEHARWAGFEVEKVVIVRKVWVDAPTEGEAADAVFDATSLLKAGDFRVVIQNVIEESLFRQLEEE